jgi:hypothetical protein
VQSYAEDCSEMPTKELIPFDTVEVIVTHFTKKINTFWKKRRIIFIFGFYSIF